MNNMDVIHMLICFIYYKFFESVILVSGMSTVWEDTDGCAKIYICVLLLNWFFFRNAYRFCEIVNTYKLSS